MGVGRFAPTKTQAWLDGEAAYPHYGALMVNDPYLTSDPLSAELAGASYRRPKIIFQRFDQILRNTGPFGWLGIPPQSRVLGIAGFTAAFNGAIVWYIPFDAPMDFPAGGQYQVATGSVYLGIDS